jgi:hypothetical protein
MGKSNSDGIITNIYNKLIRDILGKSVKNEYENPYITTSILSETKEVTTEDFIIHTETNTTK